MKTNSMRTLSIVAGVLLVLISAFLWLNTYSFPPPQSGEPGPAVWPRILLAVTAIFSLLMIVDMWRSKTDRPITQSSLRLPVLLMGATLVYLFLLAPLGYWLTTLVFIPAVLWMLGIRSWRMLVGLAVGFPLLAYLVFVDMLSVSFPAGPLSPFLGG